MTLNASTLQPGNPLLQDGLNNGFRAPDLGWVGTQRDTEVDADMLECSDLIFSNWWAGPIELAKALAETLVAEFRADLAVMTPIEDEDEFIPVVVVAYWEDAATGLGLVGQVSMTEDYLMMDGIPECLAESQKLMDQMQTLSTDGDDNSPDQLVHGAVYAQVSQAEQAALAALVASAAVEADREQVQASFQEYCTYRDKQRDPNQATGTSSTRGARSVR